MTQPTVNAAASTITVPASGSSFAELVTAIQANPASGTVSGNRVLINYRLVVAEGGTYTSAPNVNYFFDGNAILQVGFSSTCEWSRDNTITFQGTAIGHSTIQGTHRYTRLKITLDTASGRCDFTTNFAAWVGEDLTLVTAHAGPTFLHMENIAASGTQYGPTNLGGATKIINSKPSGAFPIQFDSYPTADRVYTGVDVSNAFVAGVTTDLFAPRINGNQSILREFTFANQQTDFRRGDSNATTANVVIDAPTFVGAANNLAPIRRTSAGDTHVAERMPFFGGQMVNSVAAQAFNLRIETVAGVEVFNNLLTPANLDAWTPLGETVEQHVVWVETRRSTGAAVTTRTAHNIRARRVGFQEVVLNNLTLNNPYSYSITPLADLSYTSSIADFAAVTSLNTSAQVYDYSRFWLTQNLDVDDPLTLSGGVLGSSANITLDVNASEVFSFNPATNQIVIKSATFTGDIQFSAGVGLGISAGSSMTGLYNRTTAGVEEVSIIVDGLPAGRNARAGVWLVSEGLTGTLFNGRIRTRTTMIQQVATDVVGAAADSGNSSTRIWVSPNTNYFLTASAYQYNRATPLQVNSGSLGVRQSLTLSRVIDSRGQAVFTDARETAEALGAASQVELQTTFAADGTPQFVNVALGRPMLADGSGFVAIVNSTNNTGTRVDLTDEQFHGYMVAAQRIQSDNLQMQEAFTFPQEMQAVLRADSPLTIRQLGEPNPLGAGFPRVPATYTLGLSIGSVSQAEASAVAFVDTTMGLIDVNSAASIVARVVGATLTEDQVRSALSGVLYEAPIPHTAVPNSVGAALDSVNENNEVSQWQ